MMKLCTIGFLILVIIGCGTVPARVKYAEYPKTSVWMTADDSGGYQFRQRRSVIKLDYNIDSKSFEASAAPYELTSDGSFSTLYRIWGADDYNSTTQLKVSYVDNTKFIDQLQITTKDNVADTMAKIGQVAKAILPLLSTALVSKGPEEPPIKFNKTMVDPTQPGIDKWTIDPLNKGYCVRLKDVAVESSLSLQQYVAGGIGQWQGTFPVSACATGIVEIASPCNDDGIKFSSRVTFSDADKVLPMALPSSGSLKMNSICGASVTEADKQDRVNLLDYLNDAITQIQEVSAAWKKAKIAQ